MTTQRDRNTWLRTLDLLVIGADRALATHVIETEPPGRHAGANARVRVLERPTGSSLIVHWSDPGRCLYGHQLWRIGRAPKAGRCAVSQAGIQRGEEVYRPACRGIEPENSRAMILASAIYEPSEHEDD